MMMMNTKRVLDEEKVKDFVGDFNKLFEDLAKRYRKDAEKIKTHRECFWRKYPEIFNDSSGNEDEMNIDVDTTMKTKPPIDREKTLREVEEKLLSNKTHERFTNYDGVMSDDNLSLPQKIIYLQKAIDDATRRKIYYALLQGQLLEECFLQLKKVYKETLEEMKITRQWAIFLRKLYKLVLDYSEFQFCTVPLSYIHSNFKIIKEICQYDKERWK